MLEPLVVDEQIIKSATEVASMLLKIDDLIARSNQNASWTTWLWSRNGGMGDGYGGSMDM
jgi:chaperonin GroEL (HSP60 family)